MRFMYMRVFLFSVLPLLLLSAGCSDEQVEASEARSTNVVEESSEETTSPRRRVLFFGDSITAGYGLDPERAYPALIQDRIDEQGWPFETVNAGLSGETTAGGVRRIDWLLRSPVDVFVLELGGNDGLRGLPIGGMKVNLLTIIERVRDQNPDAAIVVAGMRIPPNLGQRYATSFFEVFAEVAEEADATLIPFLMEGLVDRDLRQFDGIHPTARGQQVVAETVWEVLEPVLEQRLEAVES